MPSVRSSTQHHPDQVSDAVSYYPQGRIRLLLNFPPELAENVCKTIQREASNLRKKRTMKRLLYEINQLETGDGLKEPATHIPSGNTILHMKMRVGCQWVVRFLLANELTLDEILRLRKVKPLQKYVEAIKFKSLKQFAYPGRERDKVRRDVCFVNTLEDMERFRGVSEISGIPIIAKRFNHNIMLFDDHGLYQEGFQSTWLEAWNERQYSVNKEDAAEHSKTFAGQDKVALNLSDRQIYVKEHLQLKFFSKFFAQLPSLIEHDYRSGAVESLEIRQAIGDFIDSLPSRRIDTTGIGPMELEYSFRAASALYRDPTRFLINWSLFKPRVSDFVYNIQSLTKIKLRLLRDQSRESPEEAERNGCILGEVLRAATCLKTIDLTYGEEKVSKDGALLTRRLESGIAWRNVALYFHWPHLERLNLNGAACDAYHLVKFLQTHAPTLKKLKWKNMWLNHSAEMWWWVFERLAKDMRLEETDFLGSWGGGYQMTAKEKIIQQHILKSQDSKMQAAWRPKFLLMKDKGTKPDLIVWWELLITRCARFNLESLAPTATLPNMYVVDREAEEARRISVDGIPDLITLSYRVAEERLMADLY